MIESLYKRLGDTLADLDDERKHLRTLEASAHMDHLIGAIREARAYITRILATENDPRLEELDDA